MGGGSSRRNIMVLPTDIALMNCVLIWCSISWFYSSCPHISSTFCRITQYLYACITAPCYSICMFICLQHPPSFHKDFFTHLLRWHRGWGSVSLLWISLHILQKPTSCNHCHFPWKGLHRQWTVISWHCAGSLLDLVNSSEPNRNEDASGPNFLNKTIDYTSGFLFPIDSMDICIQVPLLPYNSI